MAKVKNLEGIMTTQPKNMIARDYSEYSQQVSEAGDSEPTNNIGASIAVGAGEKIFDDKGEDKQKTEGVGFWNKSVRHFDSDIYGQSRAQSDKEAYDNVVRDVVSNNYMKKLADSYGMSVEEINKIVHSIPFGEDKGMIVGEPDNDLLPDKDMLIGKPDDDLLPLFPDKGMLVDYTSEIRSAYYDYMNKYDNYANGNGLYSLSKTDIRVYSQAEAAAVSEIDTYLEARESLYKLKDSMSSDAYDKLIAGLVETNPVIAESIGNQFPESEESKRLYTTDIESVLNGIERPGTIKPEPIHPYPIGPSYPRDAFPIHPGVDGPSAPYPYPWGPYVPGNPINDIELKHIKEDPRMLDGAQKDSVQHTSLKDKFGKIAISAVETGKAAADKVANRVAKLKNALPDLQEDNVEMSDKSADMGDNFN